MDEEVIRDTQIVTNEWPYTIPELQLIRIKKDGDGTFETERLHLAAKGYSINEVKEGITFLLKKYKELEGK